MPFDGLRVISLESRRAPEMTELIRRQGGVPTVVPSVRETPLLPEQTVIPFAERLIAGEFDLMICQTGSGMREIAAAVEPHPGRDKFAAALRGITSVARGPKPAAALRDLGAPPTITVAEPYTWREILAATEHRPERHIAIQEYGRRNPDLEIALRERGAEVTGVRVYRWELPADTAPLRSAVQTIARGEADVIAFTSGIQADHLLQVAGEEHAEPAVRNALGRMVVASIGPSTSEALEDLGIVPDFSPSHPRMGYLVVELAACARELLTRKRG